MYEAIPSPFHTYVKDENLQFGERSPLEEKERWRTVERLQET